MNHLWVFACKFAHCLLMDHQRAMHRSMKRWSNCNGCAHLQSYGLLCYPFLPAALFSINLGPVVRDTHTVHQQQCSHSRGKECNWFADLLMLLAGASPVEWDARLEDAVRHRCDHSCKCAAPEVGDCSIAGNCQVQLREKAIHLLNL